MQFWSVHLVPSAPPPLPYQKAVYAIDEHLTEKQIMSPLRSLPPPPPPSKTASGAAGWE